MDFTIININEKYINLKIENFNFLKYDCESNSKWIKFLVDHS